MNHSGFHTNSSWRGEDFVQSCYSEIAFGAVSPPSLAGLVHTLSRARLRGPGPAGNDSWTMNYQIDTAHTTIQFAVRHMMIANVRGVFGKFSGTASFDPANAAASKVSLTVDINSVSTPDAARNEHLKGADFFDAAKYPEMKFDSKSVTAAGPGAYKVVGDLSLHGTTKEVTMNVTGMSDEVKDPWGNMRRGCAASAKISRKEFGLTWNANIEAGGVIVSDEVDVTLDVELVRQP